MPWVIEICVVFVDIQKMLVIISEIEVRHFLADYGCGHKTD